MCQKVHPTKIIIKRDKKPYEIIVKFLTRNPATKTRGGESERESFHRTQVKK